MAAGGRLRAELERRIPVIRWLRSYSREVALSDFVAGVTLGLTIIPQSIAYAALAGLTPQDGLNSAFMGCILYAFFGTIKEVVIGPSSLMALLTYDYTSELNMDFTVLLAFLTGVVQFLMGVLHLGFLVELISAPVVSGFTTATSVIIVVSQMKGLIGLNFKSEGIVDNLVKLAENIQNIRVGDTLLGIACILSLLALRKLNDVKVKNPTLKKTLWLISISRNALAVLFCALLSYHYKSRGLPLPFVTTKTGDTIMPSLRLPPTSTVIGNRTYTFQEMVSELRMGYLVIPVISVLANVAIAKAFVNGAVDATQEMLTLSLCNMGGSLVQSMPTTGAFTRSAVASASGIRTPLAGLYTAGIVLMALGFLGPYFHYIPKATLSAILISAVVFLIDWQIVKPLWRNSWLDLFTVAVTLVSCIVIGVEMGLLVGVVVGLSHLIYKWARPAIHVETHRDGEVWVRLENGLYFPAAEYLAETVSRAAEAAGNSSVFVDCARLTGTDYTVSKNIMCLKAAFDKRGQEIKFVNVPRKCYQLWTRTGCKPDYFSALEDGVGNCGDDAMPLTAIAEENSKDFEDEDLLKNPSKDHII